MGLIGADIKYPHIEIVANHKTDSDYDNMYHDYQLWEDLLSKLNSESSSSMNNAIITTPDDEWVWMDAYDVYAKNGIKCIILPVIICLLLLLFCTGNFVTGLIACLCFILAYAIAIGFIGLFQYGFSIPELYYVTIAPALILQPLLHIAVCYSMSTQSSTQSKLRDGITVAGGTVLGNFIVLLLVFVIMYSMVVVLYHKMNVFFILSSLVAAWFAIAVFPSLVLLFSPRPQTGMMCKGNPTQTPNQIPGDQE